MTIGLGHYLSVAAILFTLGIFGIFLNRKNVIIILMSIELILLAVNINLVAFSTHLGDIVGQIFALLVLTVAAAEAAIGLVLYTRYVYFFQAAGMILLVAMVGAIVLTLHHRIRVRRQDIATQVARTPAVSIEIVKVRSGQGLGSNT